MHATDIGSEFGLLECAAQDVLVRDGDFTPGFKRHLLSPTAVCALQVWLESLQDQLFPGLDELAEIFLSSISSGFDRDQVSIQIIGVKCKLLGDPCFRQLA